MGGGVAAAAAAVPGSAGSDVMFWWNTALGGSPRTFPAAMRRSAEASANFTKSKWGSGSSSRRSGRGARGGGGPTVAFSPFEVAYSVSTNSDPVVYLSTPPVYQNPNVTQNFASLVPLRKLGPLIVPIGVGGNPPCNADTNQTCLADLVGFLTSPARRAAAVAELVRVARSKGFAGWNFDQETQMQSKSAALTAGWRAFLAELAAAMKAHVDPAATVSVDICGNCGGSDYMGMFAGNWTGIGVEIVSMCTYSNFSAANYTPCATCGTYNPFDARLSCLSQSYGKETARVGLGQGIPTWNPDVGELRRQLRLVEGANLSKVAVFVAPSLYTSVEWLDVLYDWVAARKLALHAAAAAE
jgi:hypothetical protein